MFNLKGLYAQPSHIDLAHKELGEAKREYLIAQSQAEYFTAMVEYNAKRIDRLTNYVREHHETLLKAMEEVEKEQSETAQAEKWNWFKKTEETK